MSQKLDTLIINPSALRNIYQSLSSELSAIEPPIWAGLIANNLRKNEFEIDILDAEALGLTVEECALKAGEYNTELFTIVVYGQQPSASTQNMFAASILSKSLKEKYPERKIILIGGHPSALPERTLQEENVDFVCRGEGVATLATLLLEGVHNESAYKKVPGLYYWGDKGEIVKNDMAPVIAQDQLHIELPGVAWDLLPMDKYRAHNWHCFDDVNQRSPYASLYTSLGCPFKCSFCCINAPFGNNRFRYWDPDFMITEFDKLANEYGVRNIKIADEMFVLNERHFMKLCELIKERGHNFNIWAYSRIDTVKPKHLETLKNAGVNWLALGIESGSKYVRQGATKGRFGGDDIRTITKQIQDAGINVIGNYIFGLPDDDLNSMRETLDLAVELNCEMSNFYSAMAYPGSQLYNMALQNNWPLPETWLGYSQHSYECLPLPTKNCSAQEVLTFRDQAFVKFFKSENYLNMVKEKFGNVTHDHIVDMTKHSLKRKNILNGVTLVD